MLHSHAFNELKEGYAEQRKVIIDIQYSHLFKQTEPYDENHVVVGFDEFKAQGGEIRFVACN